MQKFANMKTRAWAGIGTADGLPMGEVFTPSTLYEAQETDAMLVAYIGGDGGPTPRLAKGALSTLIDVGEEPLLTGLFFDIDNPAHAPWESLEQASQALSEALNLLDVADDEGFPPEAWGGYTTRAGLRVYTILNTNIPVSKANHLLRVAGEYLTRTWDGAFVVDEACYQWTRLFRMPRATRDGVLLDPVWLAPLEPLSILPDILARLEVERGTPALDADMPGDYEELTLEEWVAAADYHAVLRRGMPLPEDHAGSTYGTLKTWLAHIANRGRITEPEKLISYVWRSVESTPGRDLHEAWRLCTWVCGEQLAEEGEEHPENAPILTSATVTIDEWEAVRAAFKGHDAKLLQRLIDGRTLAASKTQHEDKALHAARLLAEAGVHNPADIYRMMWASVSKQKAPLPPVMWAACCKAADNEKDRARLHDDDAAMAEIYTATNPLTVHLVGGGKLWQLNTLTEPPSYIPTDQVSLSLHYEKFTAPGLPFEAEYSDPRRRFPEILCQYGATVNKLAYVSGMQGCVYDPRDTGMMLEGVHHLVPCEALYHEDIDTWLRLIGGDSADLLLDWLAAVTYTPNEPLCALYIDGSPGDGKSLLARGIASLWGGRHTDYDQAAAGFNAKLLDCPLVFADEGITVGKWDDHRASEFFRNLVSGQSHAIRGLYREAVDLRGCVRVLICANDEDGIPFRKALGQDGLEAIVQRVMYIRSPRCDDGGEPLGEPGRFIASKGGRAYVTRPGAAWVREDDRPGRIAEHLHWLRENRRIKRGGRFLVEGVRNAWHNQFVAEQGYKPTVLQVVDYMLRKLDAGAPGVAGFVLRDDDEEIVWVHHASVMDNWRTVSDVRIPKPNVVLKTLKQMASGDTKLKSVNGKQVRCWPIPFQAFRDSAVWE